MKAFLIGVFALFFVVPAFSASVITGYQGQLLNGVTTTIGSTGTASAEIPTKGFSLVGITMPSAFTGSSITFTASTTTGGTFVPVTTGTAGVTLVYAVAASKYVAVDPKDFQGISFLKIVSGSSEAAARTLLLQLKGQ